ncbi:MAG TPA: signal peptidase I [Gemmataceae bacterium]|nr:signal peptidase I [Gemmataceae bacterium]
MEEHRPAEQRPLWVRVGLWGTLSRTASWVFFWLSTALAVGFVASGFWDRRFFGGALFALAALWSYLPIRWVDQHGGWSRLAVGNRIGKWIGYVLAGITVLAIVAVVVVKTAVGWFYVIPQNGMYPNLPAGSRVFGLKRPYRDVSQVARGDIIMFERAQGGQRYLYIWRVVGLPGETVEVNDDRLLVNGKEVARERVRSEGAVEIYQEVCAGATYEVAYSPKLPAEIPASVRVRVPEDHLFVLGDNRHDAVDSRSFGPIPFSSVVAKKW